MMQIPFWTLEGTIDLAELRPADLTPEILGNTLAKVNRFGGRTRQPWPVTSHCILVEYLAPVDHRPWALLHDAHEAFLGDLTFPAFELLCSCGTRAAVEHAVANAKGRLDRAIGAAWGVAVRSQSLALRRADYIALRAEAWAFLNVPSELTAPADIDDFDRALSLIPTLNRSWETSRDQWIARCQHYASLGQLSLPRAPADPSSMVLGGNPV